MKFKVPKSTLDKAIKSVSKAIPQKSIQPILNNILLETKEGKLTLNATDLDLSIEATIPSINELDGCITISAKKLEEIVSKLEEDEISFEVDLDSFKTNLICKKANFDLVALPADDFPRIDKPEIGKFLKIKRNILSKIINLVSFSASRYEINNILSGVFFGIKKINTQIIFEMAATDGNRLSSYEYILESNQNFDLDNNIEAVVPIKVVQDAQRILETSIDNEIALSFLNNQIIFFTQDRFIISRLMDGIYPKYKQLIPQNQDKIAQIDRKDFLVCLERIAVMANEITNMVKLSFGKNILEIESSNNDYGQAKEEIRIDYIGDDIKIFFNVKYLIDALKNIDSQIIQMSMISPIAAVLIKPISDENFLHLIMPIKHG